MIGCCFDSSSKASCATGNYESDEVECHDAGATPPATLAEFTLDNAGEMDFYDVSLVDGYNLPLLVQATTPDYPDSSSLVDLNKCGPDKLHANDGHTYRNAYKAFRSPRSYCNGAYGNRTPTTCPNTRSSSGPPASGTTATPMTTPAPPSSASTPITPSHFAPNPLPLAMYAPIKESYSPCQNFDLSTTISIQSYTPPPTSLLWAARARANLVDTAPPKSPPLTTLPAEWRHRHNPSDPLGWWRQGACPSPPPPPPSSPFFSWPWALPDGRRWCPHILRASFGDGIPSSVSVGRQRSPGH
jgi:hypothetical protein